MSRHTYLFKDAVWEVNGRFYDEKGEGLDVEGISRIQHKHHIWQKDSMVKDKQGGPMELYNFYEIVPPEQNEEFTRFRSQSTHMGAIKGVVMISEEDIYFKWTSEDGNYRGVDHHHMEDEHRYSTRGLMMKGVKRIASWEMKLKRI
jgi:hypothetical protein